MKQKRSYLSALKWGVVLGVCLSVFELVKMFARKIDYSGYKLLDLTLIVAFVLVLYAGIKDFKGHFTERLSFAKAYFGCILISVVGVLIFGGYGMLHYAAIEPDGLENKYETALDNFRNSIAKDTITTEELNAYLDTIKTIIITNEETVMRLDTLNDSLCTDVRMGIVKITEFHRNIILDNRGLDTTDHYLMRNIQPYTRKVLVETLTHYIEQNEERASTAYVKQIVYNSNMEIENVNPLNIRFEKNKSHVPHYEKPGRYIAVASMMNLLYGMFFGLFIAMYHYTSKRTVAEASGEFVEDEYNIVESSEKEEDK